MYKWYGNAINSLSTVPPIPLIYNAAPVNNIGAVSPAARDNVKTTPVKIPGIADGNTTSFIVSNFVAPTANAASRVLAGIRINASSVVVMMYGNDNNPNVRPADNIEVPNCNACTNKANPNKP